MMHLLFKFASNKHLVYSTLLITKNTIIQELTVQARELQLFSQANKQNQKHINATLRYIYEERKMENALVQAGKQENTGKRYASREGSK